MNREAYCLKTSPMDIRKLQKAVVNALEDIKARDVEVYDVRHLTSFFDRVVVATADSARQTKALVNHLRERAKAIGGTILGVEGEETGDWVLVDLGDIVVHIMQPAVRAHYNLEELWNQPKPRAPRKRPARSTAAG
jgi:ribosome-associated protein